MASQSLRLLRVSAGAGEVRDELVPKSVKVEHAARLVSIRNPRRREVRS
jgi:hypothetical protein